ncbi:MAG TPA: hypothetical protein VK453_16490 [Micromonosporaceae bacterium]|nr:hypothetical protein [Micromonosporaceae bacterium]
MHSWTAERDSRLSLWLRVREFAVPPSMIESATARRSVGDWAGACAAAGVDVDLNLRSAARVHGQALATQVRADLRCLAPDLLRWHLPRIAPDGLLRPGLTVSLARYRSAAEDGSGRLHLVARTPPAWADAGQRISLALWDGSGSRAGPCRDPHPRPNRRFRFDLHRHLWDARRSGELRGRSAADQLPTGGGPDPILDPPGLWPPVPGCAVDRWAAEAGILLRAERAAGRAVAVRLATRHQLVLHLAADTMEVSAVAAGGRAAALPMLPDAATWVPPDLELLRAGLIDADRLHPLVATALVPDRPLIGARRTPDRAGSTRIVECRGARHRIGPVDGVLVPLDHDPAEIRREELLAGLTGTPVPCLQEIDRTHRRPECLVDVRARLDHGDTAGALAAVEALLGPGALLRNGALREELETAALRQISYGLFRAGLAGFGPLPTAPHRHSGDRARRRHAIR